MIPAAALPAPGQCRGTDRAQPELPFPRWCLPVVAVWKCLLGCDVTAHSYHPHMCPSFAVYSQLQDVHSTFPALAEVWVQTLPSQGSATQTISP